MEVSDALIDKLALLARLRIAPGSRESLKADLQKMISFVQKLEEVNTDGVEPLTHMSDEQNILRKDEVQESSGSKAALQNAAAHTGQFFLVPRIIQKQ